MIREPSYGLDLDESARSCWSDSKDSDGGAVVAPHRAGCCVCWSRVDSGGEMDVLHRRLKEPLLSIQDHPEFESRRAELEEKWAITWEAEFKKKPSPEELRAHPRYDATLRAWLAGYGIKDS